MLKNDIWNSADPITLRDHTMINTSTSSFLSFPVSLTSNHCISLRPYQVQRPPIKMPTYLHSIALLVTVSLRAVTSTPTLSLQHNNTSCSSACTSFNVSVTVTSEDLVYNGTIFKDNYDAINFITHASSKDPYSASNVFSGTKNTTATYEIAATFCTPKTPRTEHNKTVLLATHGLFYDSRFATLHSF